MADSDASPPTQDASTTFPSCLPLICTPRSQLTPSEGSGVSLSPYSLLGGAQAQLALLAVALTSLSVTCALSGNPPLTPQQL